MILLMRKLICARNATYVRPLRNLFTNKSITSNNNKPYLNSTYCTRKSKDKKLLERN